MRYYPEPFDDMPMLDPVRPPLPGEILLGYELVNEQGQIFSYPRPTRMNRGGCLMMGVLGLLFWPVMCLPCVCSTSYDVSQRPVYGNPRYRNGDRSIGNRTSSRRCAKQQQACRLRRHSLQSRSGIRGTRVPL